MKGQRSEDSGCYYHQREEEPTISSQYGGMEGEGWKEGGRKSETKKEREKNGKGKSKRERERGDSERTEQSTVEFSRVLNN